ncbi:endonuclease domain-containing protein [Mycolicibacterium psychrotolerans]|uniref:endonuclease domain-containing protein n=1 Tax=Mycolicibacterium psychrotolerans TaxID=216929 RepID=UPI003D666132
MQTIAWPFRAAEALDAKALTLRELRRFHAAVYPGVWTPRGVELSAIDRARAAWLWSGRRGVLAGLSASALLGAKWIDPDVPAELVHTNRRAPQLISVHSDALLPAEIQQARGLPVTTPARTAFDLGRRLDFTTAVQRIDALMNATDVKVDDVWAVMAQHGGVRGLRQLTSLLDLVDGGAESPYESLTRILLVRNGFPRPQTQVRVCDDDGYVVARLDMGWPEYRVGVDFDGAHHWTDPKQRSKDVERYARLPELGWIDVRVTSSMLHNNPRVILDRVGQALTARGCARTW